LFTFKEEEGGEASLTTGEERVRVYLYPRVLHGRVHYFYRAAWNVSAD